MTNLQQLHEAVIWSISTETSKEWLQHIVESMPQRIKAVLKAKGSQTQCQQGVPNKVTGVYGYVYSTF